MTEKQQTWITDGETHKVSSVSKGEVIHLEKGQLVITGQVDEGAVIIANNGTEIQLLKGSEMAGQIKGSALCKLSGDVPDHASIQGNKVLVRNSSRISGSLTAQEITIDTASQVMPGVKILALKEITVQPDVTIHGNRGAGQTTIECKGKITFQGEIKWQSPRLVRNKEMGHHILIKADTIVAPKTNFPQLDLYADSRMQVGNLTNTTVTIRDTPAYQEGGNKVVLAALNVTGVELDIGGDMVVIGKITDSRIIGETCRVECGQLISSEAEVSKLQVGTISGSYVNAYLVSVEGDILDKSRIITPNVKCCNFIGSQFDGNTLTVDENIRDSNIFSRGKINGDVISNSIINTEGIVVAGEIGPMCRIKSPEIRTNRVTGGRTTLLRTNNLDSVEKPEPGVRVEALHRKNIR